MILHSLGMCLTFKDILPQIINADGNKGNDNV